MTGGVAERSFSRSRGWQPARGGSRITVVVLVMKSNASSELDRTGLILARVLPASPPPTCSLCCARRWSPSETVTRATISPLWVLLLWVLLSLVLLLALLLAALLLLAKY